MGNLIAEDEIESFAGPCGGRREIRHAPDAAQGLEPGPHALREERAAHPDVQRVSTSVNTQPRIVGRREHGDTVTGRLELPRGVHDEPLGAAKSEARVQKGDTQRLPD